MIVITTPKSAKVRVLFGDVQYMTGGLTCLEGVIARGIMSHFQLILDVRFVKSG